MNNSNDNVINSSNNSSNDTNSSNLSTSSAEFTNFKGITDQNNVKASLNGPKKSSQGNTVTLIVKITNNGNDTINNVNIDAQGVSENLGTISPKETKIFKYSFTIPTLSQIKEDFGQDSSISNPFFIGGYSISYDLNGENFQFNTNNLEINLV